MGLSDVLLLGLRKGVVNVRNMFAVEYEMDGMRCVTTSCSSQSGCCRASEGLKLLRVAWHSPSSLLHPETRLTRVDQRPCDEALSTVQNSTARCSGICTACGDKVVGACCRHLQCNCGEDGNLHLRHQYRSDIVPSDPGALNMLRLAVHSAPKVDGKQITGTENESLDSASKRLVYFHPLPCFHCLVVIIQYVVAVQIGLICKHVSDLQAFQKQQRIYLEVKSDQGKDQGLEVLHEIVKDSKTLRIFRLVDIYQRANLGSLSNSQ